MRFFIPGAGYPSERQIAHSLDEFAELLSRDLPLNDIATAMQITRGTACVLLHWLRERIGPQAN